MRIAPAQRTGAICKREGLVLFHEFFIQKVQIHLNENCPGAAHRGNMQTRRFSSVS
nr:MAG TPA: hypothetical protein [Caudoviricetes sp.]